MVQCLESQEQRDFTVIYFCNNTEHADDTALRVLIVVVSQIILKARSLHNLSRPPGYDLSELFS